MPRHRFPFLFCCVALALAAGCRVKDIRTATVLVPGLRTADDARAAVAAIGTLALVGYPQESPQRPDSLADDPASPGGAAIVARWHHPSAVRTISVERVVAHYDGPRRGEIDVTYDSMKLARKNLELAVSEAGFLVKAEPYDFEPSAGTPPARAAARP